MAFQKTFTQTLQKSLKNTQPFFHEVDTQPTSQNRIEKSSRSFFSSVSDSNRKTQQVNPDRLIPASTLRRMYKFNCVVRAAVDTIIREVCAANWDIVQKDPEKKFSPEKRKKIEEIKNFFEHPNENGETFNVVLEMMLKDLLILDAGVLEKTKNGNKLKELIAIDGSTIRIDADQHKKLMGYTQVNEKGIKEVSFQKNELIYIMMNPRTESLYGMSPLETLHNIITAFLYSETHNIKFFENNVTPRGILYVGTSMSEENMDRFREYWRQENLGNPHRVMVLGGPSMEASGPGSKEGVQWIPMAMNSKDMELMQYLNWLTKMILMVFGVSPSEVGFTEDMQRAPATSMYLQSIAFKNKAILPIMKRIESFFTEEIIRHEFDEDDLKFKFIEELSINEKMLKAQMHNIQIMSGVKTVEMIRKEEGIVDETQEQNEGQLSPDDWFANFKEKHGFENDEDAKDKVEDLVGTLEDITGDERPTIDTNKKIQLFKKLSDLISHKLTYNNIDKNKLTGGKQNIANIMNDLESKILNYIEKRKLQKSIEKSYKILEEKLKLEK